MKADSRPSSVLNGQVARTRIGQVVEFRLDWTGEVPIRRGFANGESNVLRHSKIDELISSMAADAKADGAALLHSLTSLVEA